MTGKVDQYQGSPTGIALYTEEDVRGAFQEAEQKAQERKERVGYLLDGSTSMRERTTGGDGQSKWGILTNHRYVPGSRTHIFCTTLGLTGQKPHLVTLPSPNPFRDLDRFGNITVPISFDPPRNVTLPQGGTPFYSMLTRLLESPKHHYDRLIALTDGADNDHFSGAFSVGALNRTGEKNFQAAVAAARAKPTIVDVIGVAVGEEIVARKLKSLCDLTNGTYTPIGGY